MENIKELLEKILTEVIKNSLKKADEEGYTYIEVEKDGFLKLFKESDLESLVIGDMEGFEIHDFGELVSDMLEEFELAECTEATICLPDNSNLEKRSDNKESKGYRIYPYEVLQHLL